MSIFVFTCELIGYLGVIRVQRKWRKRGVLNEVNFVLFQAPVLSLLVLSGFLAFSRTPTGITLGIVLSALCLIVGIPIARKIYRERFANK
jgi:hypothetical protein